ncbi:4'-phosphopantetheinyl transferase superfamily protein [Micromonospora sp. WMMD1120]|uniref:4'-phosphopantetheinyl transferase family protein n=1 Tax=Micromonospora sp. WMMD1120 TaxID=3016106 RepID=UPI002417E9CC|nr:4'-phosphopantetheinyl transferase superfamily protein [Micromonospora sp. WMMD1120]MDG4810791.1 4'-phosphopantetheinyl transferase superfamily protein [Micromonospora sp. WMMD1120]
MIAHLLPRTVVAVETFTDRPGEAVFPGEADLIANAVDGRRREFITARRCAREALLQLGRPPAPIRPGPRREPLWPPGVVGSITHCAGYRAAAVGLATDIAALGIDAEPHGPLPDGVLDSVTAAGDADLLTDLARHDPTTHWDRLLFSAKESIYKAWYPLTRRWLGFEDASLTIDRATATFTGRLHVPGDRHDGGPDLRELRGRYVVTGGLVLTAVTVPD